MNLNFTANEISNNEGIRILQGTLKRGWNLPSVILPDLKKGLEVLHGKGTDI